MYVYMYIMAINHRSDKTWQTKMEEITIESEYDKDNKIRFVRKK